MEYLVADDPTIGFLPTLYFARMDVDLEGLDAFNSWYRDKHAPDLISAGFYSAHGYQCLEGNPFICNLYEIPSSEIFYTPDYQEKRTPEHAPQRPAILETVSNRSNTTYEQVTVMSGTRPSAPWVQGNRECAVDGRAISTIRFDADQAAGGDLSDWISEQMRTGAFNSFGVLAVRLCRRFGRPHPANPSSEPDWVLITEWESKGAAASGRSEALEIERLTKAPVGLSGIEYNFAVRSLSLRDLSR